jgi:site-specific DNA-cytosine methylase
VSAFTFGSLFAGIGGMDLGLERAGLTCRWQVEIDPYCRKVLAKHWPDVPKLEDVRDAGAHNLQPVGLIAGGFPCQDISNAGKRAGIDGERSGLWSEYARIIRELRPRYVLVENVSALLARGFERVLGRPGRSVQGLLLRRYSSAAADSGKDSASATRTRHGGRRARQQGSKGSSTTSGGRQSATWYVLACRRGSQWS